VVAFSGTEVADESIVEALGLIDRALISGTAGALLSGDAGRALELIDQVYNYGYDTKEFVTQLLEHFRGLVVCKISPDPGKILDLLDVELEELKGIAAETSLETLNFFFKALLESLEDLRRSTRPRLALEALMVSLAQVEPVRPLAELVSRMEDLLESVGPGFRDSDVPPYSNDSYDREPAMAGRLSDGPSEPNEIPAVQNIPAEAAPTAETVPGQEPEWGDFLSSIKEKNNHLLYTLLERAEVRLFNPEKVELLFTKKSEVDFIKSNRKKLKDFLFEYLKARPRLSIAVSPDQADAMPQGKPAGNADRPAVNEKAVRDHPLVKSAQELLGAKLVKIIPNTN
ncbi:MAG: hypothetical protein JRI34_08780, partial [Deltaproteobacteria bacterium]|nr:hypothetical protein [Deltaproteobacteria bacterium]